MIRLLIVEDSPVVQELLIYIFSSDPNIKIVGIAKDGLDALDKYELLKPDIITMDINMPYLNGIETTKKIMSSNPVPVVIISGSCDSKEVELTFDAMDAGALAVLAKPSGIFHPDFKNMANEILNTVKAMAEVKLVRRWSKPDSSSKVNGLILNDRKHLNSEFKLVAIGASTGGPVILQKILSSLPKDFSVPVLIVQHMSEGFIHGFVEWLNHSSSIHVKLAQPGESLLPGYAYVAPDGLHMGIGRNEKIILVDDITVNGLRPTVSFLFRSVANTFGGNSIAVLLTGMGSDGVEELKLLKEKGAVTIVQDKETSVIYGMPGEAVKIGAETYILSPDKIVSVLTKLTNHVNLSDHNI